MKISQRKLKQIIREELQKELLKEAVNPAAVIAQIEKLLGTLKASIAPKQRVASRPADAGMYTDQSMVRKKGKQKGKQSLTPQAAKAKETWS